jgi:hypothetical protein
LSQYNWILLDDFGNRFKVGIYHGEKSGHVLIHCNKKVMIIDFNVLGNKTYSFFLGYEFCELKVIKGGGGSYHYDLSINEKVDTVLNKKRKKIRRKDNIKAFLLAVLFFALVIILTYIFQPVEVDI